MTTLALSPAPLSLDRSRETADLTRDLALDLTVVTIESMVARDISAFTERRRSAGGLRGVRDRTTERGAR